MGPVGSVRRSPSTAKVAEQIRRHYLADKLAAFGEYLPGERELAERYEVARVTVRRALRKLAAEGLVRPEPGRGYRPLPRSNGLKPGSPAAHIVSAAHPEENTWTSTAEELINSMQRVLAERGCHALVVGTKGMAPGELVRSIVEAGVWGAVLDTVERPVIEAVVDTGLPCVCIDCFSNGLHADCVLQDNHGGGRLAAEHLIARGHRRIGWVGDVALTDHSLERFTGAQAGFLRRGRELSREFIVETTNRPEEDERAIRALLSRPDRPTAVLALWAGVSLTVARISRELGLEIGRDLDLVAWSTEIGYHTQIEREFGPGRAPATVVWDTEEGARIAANRLAWRQREPGLAPIRISVPTRLALPEGDSHA